MNRIISRLRATTALKPAALAISLAAIPCAPAAAQTVQPEVVFLSAPDITTAPTQCRGVPGGSDTYAAGLSADGTIVGGGATNSFCLVLWRNGVPEVQAGRNPESLTIGNVFGVTGMSGDGRTLVGYDNEIFSLGLAHYWTQASDTQLFPILETLTAAEYNALPGRSGAASIVTRRPFNESFANTDGRFFAVNTAFDGQIFDTSGNGGRTIIPDGRVYRWSPTSGYLELPQLGGSLFMSASGISGDGSRIIGNANDRSNVSFGRDVAWLWVEGTGISALPALSLNPRNDAATGGQPLAASAEAWGISRDGSTIVGTSRDANGRFQAVYWRGGTVTGLGFLNGNIPNGITTTDNHATIALGTNLDGSVIVGSNGAVDTAWRWSATTGMQDLNIFAQNAGLNLNGLRLYSAFGVSDNGQTIVGNATNLDTGEGRGFLLTIAQITRTQLIVRVVLPGVTLQSIVNQSFNTRVDGTLNGSTVFTRSFADTIDSSAGTTALADARAALQATTGLRRVVIGAPTLVSNTTTVLSTTNSTVNVPSGSSVSTATINTFGPATVTTGDLGVCATGVVGSTAPTGCSLPGTPVNVDPGILNSNIYTTTAETVTPTTTPTVNQRIDARWQVAATAGNRFGTAHALVGPASFERSDRLVMQLIGMGASGSESSATIARAASPMKQQMALGDSDSGFSMFGGYFNASTRIDADAALAIARAKGKADGFVLGVQKELGDVARIGIAVDHGKSDYSVRDATYPETLDLKQTQIGLYGGWNSGRFALSGAAAYSFGDVKTAIASLGGTSIGNRDISGWSLGAQGSYTLPVGKSASLTLMTGLRHSSADLKRFAEVGGLTPLVGLDGETHRTRLYAGLQGEARIALGSTTITPRLYGRYAHDSGDASGIADVVFASAPNAAPLQAIGAPIGRDVAELGGSIEAQIGGNVAIWGGYDGQFRSSAQSHTAKVGVTIAF